VLFDIVNTASEVAPDAPHRSRCPATQTRRRQNHNRLQIQHDAARSSSARAWLLTHVPMPSDVSTWTQLVQNAESDSPFEQDKGVHRQGLDLFCAWKNDEFGKS
jgi:hypothetical protein